MPNPNDYPSSVQEVLDPNMTFRPAALQAVREFARSKPWRGTLEERYEKFRKLNVALATAYEVAVPQLIFGGDPDGDSGKSCYVPALATIIIKGRLSVVTFLHEWGHHRGYGEREACRWSVNLFRRCFPKSFARCRFESHLLRRVPRA